MRMMRINMGAVLCLWLIGTALAAGSPPPVYRLHVDGLACPFCAYGIEKKLGALAGVGRIETHIKDGVVIVIMKEGFTLDEATAKKAVKEAGFSLRKIEPVQSAPEGRAQ